MLLTVVLLVAVFGLASDNFLDPFNIINILRSIAIVTVIAIGVSISLTIGGFDLSVGSTASLANALVISCLSGMAWDHRSDSDNPCALHHGGAV